MEKETRRQFLHIGIGLAIVAFLLLFGRESSITLSFIVLVGGGLLVNAKLRGIKTDVFEWGLKQFERKRYLFPGWGSICFMAGILIPLTFLIDVNHIATSIFILSVGDAFSTLIGKRGRIKLLYNKKKTLEGSLAFLLSSLLAYYFVGPLIIPLALITTALESLPTILNDNLTIPVACTIFFMVV